MPRRIPWKFTIAASVALALPAPAAFAQDFSLIPDASIASESIQLKQLVQPVETPVSVAADDHQIEVINERYDDGSVKIRREMTQDAQGNYILHGEWKMWDPAGNLVAEGQYKNDQRHGAWTRWYRGNEADLFSTAPYKDFQGPFISQANFDNGKLQGDWVIYDAKQTKISQWSYQNGLRNGPAIWWYANGRKMQEINYSNGLIDGERLYWANPSAEPTSENYEMGRKLASKVDYHRAGLKKTAGMYLFAKHVIKTTDDWWAAKPVTYTTEGTDVKHGEWSAWHANGQLETQGKYEHDMRVGEFTWWFQNGQKRLQGSYENGKPHGEWTWWHKNGQKATQGEYAYGDPRGPWLYWKEDGRLFQKGDFAEGSESIVAVPEDAEPETTSSRKATRPQLRPLSR